MYLEINECDSHPCANGGKCEDKLASFKCTCAPGYTGVQCRTGIEQSKDCYNLAMNFERLIQQTTYLPGRDWFLVNQYSSLGDITVLYNSLKNLANSIDI